MAIPTTRTFWNVPYQRNPFFTGREDILSRLDRALHAEQSVALSQPQGITGLGGIGKTQTVAEYAYRHREEYRAVFWVRADSVTSLTSSMVEIAQLLDLPERNKQDQELIVQSVLRWLRLHSDWLLIYDNIDDLPLAEPYLPKAGTGHLLFTTRAYALGGLAQRLDIQQMDPETGAHLLLRRASLLALQATFNTANPDEQRLAQAISQELDGLPLALDQAGAYIKETPCPLPDYQALYQTRRANLLRVRGRFDQDYPASVATTWALSFEKASQANPAAPELLNFCAFLAPDAIPEELLTAGASHLGAPLALVMANPLQFDQVCKEVLRFSLLRRGADERTLTVHRLVQAVLKDTMDKPTQKQWAERAAQAVNEVFPEVEFETWPQCERYLPHALVCTELVEQEHIGNLEAARLLYETGRYLIERARSREAQLLLQQALRMRERLLGLEHSDTAMTVERLARCFKDQGKYSEAESLYRRALKIREQLESEHLHTAQSLNNLAILYQTQGKYARAERLYRQALAIYEQQLGADHPDTATSLYSLAELYRNQGKYRKAEPLHRRALEIIERELGADHPNTATSLNNLGLLYCNQGKYAEAEPLYRRALEIREQQLGADHPDTATSLNNLAELYRDQEKDAEAEPLYRRALSIHEKVYGLEHPEVTTYLNNLAVLLRDQGKHEEAESLFKRALSIDEEAHGPLHPDVAGDLNNLAALYDSQGKYAQAEPLYVRALAISEEQLGASHPSTALSLNNLAALYDSQGKYRKAEPLHRRALEIREQQLGADHPDTAQSLNNLALLYQHQGKYAEAESLYRRALEIREQQLGADHPDTAQSLNNLAELYRDQEKDAEAEPLYRRALSIDEKVYGLEHPAVATDLNNLALLYNSQGKYAQAEPLYVRALAIQEEQLGTWHPDTALCLNNLALLYDNQGKYAQAEPLYMRALAICEQVLGTEHPTTQAIQANYTAFLKAMKRKKRPHLK